MSAIFSLRYLEGLRRALDTGSEREVHAFLKRWQRSLIVAYARGWNAIVVVPEFRFGRDYRADFLVLSSLSGALYATIIELEPPSARIYLADGTESQVLRRAIRQVKDWQAWVSSFQGQFRRELAAEILRARREDRRISTQYVRFCEAELLDHNRVIIDRYVILIGRRSTLSSQDNARRGHEARGPGLDISTYDRLLDIGADDKRRFNDLRQHLRSTA